VHVNKKLDRIGPSAVYGLVFTQAQEDQCGQYSSTAEEWGYRIQYVVTWQGLNKFHPGVDPEYLYEL